MMVPRVDEAVAVGGRWIVLSGAEYNDGRVEGEGGRYLKEFRWDCQTPVWLLEIEGHRLEKRIIIETVLDCYHGPDVVYAHNRLRRSLRSDVISILVDDVFRAKHAVHSSGAALQGVREGVVTPYETPLLET
jgi:hypothetical protein